MKLCKNCKYFEEASEQEAFCSRRGGHYIFEVRQVPEE